MYFLVRLNLKKRKKKMNKNKTKKERIIYSLKNLNELIIPNVASNNHLRMSKAWTENELILFDCVIDTIRIKQKNRTQTGFLKFQNNNLSQFHNLNIRFPPPKNVKVDIYWKINMQLFLSNYSFLINELNINYSEIINLFENMSQTLFSTIKPFRIIMDKKKSFHPVRFENQKIFDFQIKIIEDIPYLYFSFNSKLGMLCMQSIILKHLDDYSLSFYTGKHKSILLYKKLYNHVTSGTKIFDKTKLIFGINLDLLNKSLGYEENDEENNKNKIERQMQELKDFNLIQEFNIMEFENINILIFKPTKHFKIHSLEISSFYY
jgi:hypothetical protein